MKTIRKEVHLAELRGAGIILDMLWSNSYYRCGHETAGLIENEMKYLFGEDWSETMYKLIGNNHQLNPLPTKKKKK